MKEHGELSQVVGWARLCLGRWCGGICFRYNIAKKKLSKTCVKDDTVFVVQMTEKRDGRWMIITKCGDKRTVTFSLVKREGHWKVRAFS